MFFRNIGNMEALAEFCLDKERGAFEPSVCVFLKYGGMVFLWITAAFEN